MKSIWGVPVVKYKSQNCAQFFSDSVGNQKGKEAEKNEMNKSIPGQRKRTAGEEENADCTGKRNQEEEIFMN